MVNRPAYWNEFVEKLAREGVVPREQSEKWYSGPPQGARLFNDVMKLSEVEADEKDIRDEDDDKKVESKLRAWAALMVTVDPTKSEEEHLYDLINTARGRRRAEHLNNLSKKGQTMPQVDIRKLIPIMEEGLLAQAKLAKRDGETEAEAFAKLYDEDIEFRKSWATVTEAKHRLALTKSVNIMSTTPTFTEVGSTETVDDSAEAVRLLNEMADRQHRTFEEVFLDQANAKLAARTYQPQQRPTASSTSGDELQRR